MNMKIWDAVKDDFEGDTVNEDWKKGIAATAIAAASLLGGNAQVPKNVPNQAITQQMNTNKDTLSPEMMGEWNNFIMWLKSKGLAGNPKMDHIAFSQQAMTAYKQENPDSKISYDIVRPVQTQIKNFRQYSINKIRQGKMDVKPVKDFNLAPDYSNYMDWVNKTTEDGILGQYTSQFMFPKYYITYMTDANRGVTTDMGYSTKL